MQYLIASEFAESCNATVDFDQQFADQFSHLKQSPGDWLVRGYRA